MAATEEVSEDEEVGDRFAGSDQGLEGKKRVWGDEEREGSHHDPDKSKGMVAKKTIS